MGLILRYISIVLLCMMAIPTVVLLFVIAPFCVAAYFLAKLLNEKDETVEYFLWPLGVILLFWKKP